MMVLTIVLLAIVLTVLSITLGAVIRWGEGRRLAVFVRQMQAEQRIDDLTRSTIARMRDAARERGSFGPGVEVVPGLVEFEVAVPRSMPAVR